MGVRSRGLVNILSLLETFNIDDVSTETRFSFSTVAARSRRRVRGGARVRAPAVIVVALTAALANPLLREYGAVDRREAVAHTDGQKWGHS